MERGPHGRGVGRWVPLEKHTLLAKWLGGTKKAWAKWPQRVFIDPFCGPGRIQVEGESATRDGGCVVAWRQSKSLNAPFTQVLVGDIDEQKVLAAASRLERLQAPVRYFVGPADETTPQMVSLVSPGALALAYIDPYNLELLSFDVIRAIARLRHVDFAVHFSLMDLIRNVDMELDPDRDRFDKAAPGWRNHVVERRVSKSQLSNAFFEYWCGLIRNLGFAFSKEMPLVRNEQGRAIYRLIFFSRHDFPKKIWDDVSKTQDPNMPLF